MTHYVDSQQFSCSVVISPMDWVNEVQNVISSHTHTHTDAQAHAHVTVTLNSEPFNRKTYLEKGYLRLYCIGFSVQYRISVKKYECNNKIGKNK